MILQNAVLAPMLRDAPYRLIERGAVVLRGDRIVWTGPEADLPKTYDRPEQDLEGRLITPTLIDCHTHIVHGGTRAGEFEMRLNGYSYTEMARVKAIHGMVVLYDCHSIRSCIPFLFEGTLPDYNIGTNGRFKGGWTTRHYERPGEGYHAIQMELAQSAYMEESPPWPYLHGRADRLRPYLKSICATSTGWPGKEI